MSLARILTQSIPYLPEQLRSEWVRLFHTEHLDKLASRLQTFHESGVPATQPEPHFSAEITPPLTSAFAPFQSLLVSGIPTEQTEIDLQSWANAMAEVGIASLLLLLGQRVTPGSLTDSRAIPPTREVLMESAHSPNRPTEKLTVAARALAKHAPRSDSSIWGIVQGSDAEKNASAERMIEKILNGTTWWNVFGHYVHDTVFEARLSSGHGARWGRDGTVFIGFLEPFLEEERSEE